MELSILLKPLFHYKQIIIFNTHPKIASSIIVGFNMRLSSFVFARARVCVQMFFGLIDICHHLHAINYNMPYPENSIINIVCINVIFYQGAKNKCCKFINMRLKSFTVDPLCFYIIYNYSIPTCIY